MRTDISTPSELNAEYMLAGSSNCLSKNVALVLLPEFTMTPATSVIEALRLTNHLSERELYKWSVHSPDGGHVMASNHMTMASHGDLSRIPDGSTVIVCGGLNVRRYLSSGFIAWLRNARRIFPDIGALCTGAYSLAEAGLLDGYHCTVHWECLADFATSFPAAKVTSNLFEIDRDRFTCAGGTTALDMILAMISNRHGAALATAVAESIIHSPVRTRRDRQPMAASTQLGSRHPKILAIVKQMERTLGSSIQPRLLAKDMGISTRQLERLFQRYIGRSPKRYHLELRLQEARRLLLHTDLSVAEISAACGFTSSSYFTRNYSAVYKYPPNAERGMPEQSLPVSKI